MAESTDETVIGRWSRRKATAATADGVVHACFDEEKAEAQTPAASESVHATVDTASRHEQPPVEEDETLEPLLTDEDMPDVETLTSDSNVSCFFNRGVSEKLRQAALKKLLRLPAFNIRDGLNDYDEDYTYFEPLGDIVTSDMRYHKERLEALANKEAEEHTDEIDADSDTAELAEADASDEAVTGNESTDTEADSLVADGQADEQTESEVRLEDTANAYNPDFTDNAPRDNVRAIGPSDESQSGKSLDRISPGKPA